MKTYKPKAFKALLTLPIQFFGGQTLFELKQSIATLGQQLQKVEGELSQKAMDPSASLEDIQASQKSKQDLQARFDIVKQQHDQLEKEQQAKLAAQQSQKKSLVAGMDDPKAQRLEAKADYYKAIATGRTPTEDVVAVLADNNETGGGKFLPKTVSEEIIHEPFVKNPLREHSAFTQITNLEIPKIGFELDDDDFINDTETAKEIEASGDSVVFGRHKFKVKVKLSETVIHGSKANLVAVVDKGLQSGLAAKEKKVAFTKTPKTGEEHMSFYRKGTLTAPAIKKVPGEDLLKAIKKCIADLPEEFRENAEVTMRYTDYVDILDALSNGTTSFYNAQPEQIIGKPCIFVDAADKPIVGDFKNYSHYNYDLEMLNEQGKDLETGVNLFVLTAWLDHQIKLASAFRIADVTTVPAP
ncbi:phage major capsid protein [Viridibacillus arvi]|uniref:phage major capsid protein n=1 Tax=Viridibacillus arvi TaxID=263475 RepID=UPI003D00D5EC